MHVCCCKTLASSPWLVTAHADLPSKRAHGDKDQSPIISKRQCPETAGGVEDSLCNLWKILPTQMTPLFCAPLSEGLGEEEELASSSGSSHNTEMKNQEVNTKD